MFVAEQVIGVDTTSSPASRRQNAAPVQRGRAVVQVSTRSLPTTAELALELLDARAFPMKPLNSVVRSGP